MNRVFFPQPLLDILMDLGKVDLEGDDLIIKDAPFRYKASEAVRVLREVTTGDDPHDLCGKVSARNTLTDELGAELLGNSMLVEDNAYDITPGFVGEPVGEPVRDGDADKSEEDLLTSLQDIEALM